MFIMDTCFYVLFKLNTMLLVKTTEISYFDEYCSPKVDPDTGQCQGHQSGTGCTKIKLFKYNKANVLGGLDGRTDRNNNKENSPVLEQEQTKQVKVK